ncbi:hypothetical protein [Mycoplasma sp. OR1901]|uniref:hypothetical protein n=1 Tax=Mycoplasma sp. OR1901 TaxID=2742195 RepID=UPI0015817199|nr:hypothetical protein [Mycoplasma sp. OR1901]QKT05465.1 hypothetical protein HTZ87_01975 [Mycoplasma sp. OR1901]
MTKKYKFLLIATAFLSVATTTTAIVMTNKKKKITKEKEINIRYIIKDENNPNKAKIDYTTLLINRLADKIIDAQNFVKDNDVSKQDPKIIKLQEKLKDSSSNLGTIIKDNNSIINELEELNNLLEEAKSDPNLNGGNNNTNINIGSEKPADNIINVSLIEARNNVREKLNEAVIEIEKVKSSINDQAMNDVTEKANEYISIAKEALESESDVNKLQAFLTISLDKKTEVLLSAKKIQRRKNEIKDNLLKIKDTFDKFNQFYLKNVENTNLVEGISRYIAFNFEKFEVYNEGNNYIFNFLDFYYKNRESKNNDEIILPKDLINAKNKLIEFLNTISNDQKFLDNIQSVELKDLENLEKILDNWLFPNYTINRFHQFNVSIINRFLKYESKDYYSDNYDKYLYNPNDSGGPRPPRQRQDQDENIKNLTKDTTNKDWMWLDNLKNEKIFKNNEIIKNEKNLDETFRFDVILNEINKLSIDMLITQLDNLKTFIDQKTPDDTIKLVDFANLVYSEDFIKELFLSYENDLNELYIQKSNRDWNYKPNYNRDFAEFSVFYKELLKSFLDKASEENKNRTINIKDIKDTFINSINSYKNEIENKTINMDKLNNISSGDFRDLFISSIMWKFNDELLKLPDNNDVLDINENKDIYKNKIEENTYYNGRQNNNTEYYDRTYKKWYDSKDQTYKDKVITLLSKFDANINDTVFLPTGYDEENNGSGLGDLYYIRGDQNAANEAARIDINNSKEYTKKELLNYNNKGIEKNFRNTLQNGFDMFIFNLSNKNNTKDKLNAIYNYINTAFEKRKSFFEKEENKTNINYSQNEYLSEENGKNETKLDFNKYHIQKRFKKLVEKITENDLTFATISNNNNLKINNNSFNNLNVLVTNDKEDWNSALIRRGGYLHSYGSYRSYSIDHRINLKNFINWKYSNILINYDLLYTLVKIADYLNSTTYNETKMTEIWTKFKKNFDFENNDYDAEYFITNSKYSINQELKEALDNI